MLDGDDGSAVKGGESGGTGGGEEGCRRQLGKDKRNQTRKREVVGGLEKDQVKDEDDQEVEEQAQEKTRGEGSTREERGTGGEEQPHKS